ncbi:MAG TPA: rod shape-determining protein MreC [Candidatus Limnocylindria bacterium]|jgi:rod shape-determining protein MreC
MRISSLGTGPSSSSRRSRATAWWAVLVVISIGLVVVSGTGPARQAQEVAARFVAPIQEAVSGIGRGISELAETIGEVGSLRAENDELSSELAGAEQRIAELQEAARENARLRALLGLQAVLGWDLAPARVVAAGTGALTWEVAVDVGRADGIRVGMPVVAAAADGAGGLAGLVVEVRADRSIIQLTVDPRSRVVARDQQTEALGVIQGQPGGQLVMTQVPVTDTVAVGDTIITAGLELEGVAASPYPRGLLIGRVSAIEADPNGLTQTVFVRPAIDPRAVEWLMVVRSASVD